MLFLDFCFFFCKQKTAYEMRISDWSSDVCSSDLASHQRLRKYWCEAGMILDEFVRGCPSFRICRDMRRGTRAPEDLRLSYDAWVLAGEFGRSREDEQGMSFAKGRRGARRGGGRRSEVERVGQEGGGPTRSRGAQSP